jgi:hypothetical protein
MASGTASNSSPDVLSYEFYLVTDTTKRRLATPVGHLNEILPMTDDALRMHGSALVQENPAWVRAAMTTHLLVVDIHAGPLTRNRVTTPLETAILTSPG